MDIENFIELFEYFENRQNEEIINELYMLRVKLENLEKTVNRTIEEYDILIEDLK